LGLDTGAPVAVLRVGEALMPIPERNRFRLLCESITSAFERRQLPPADLLDTLPEARERIFTRRYPEPAGPPRHRMRRPSKEIDALRTRARFFIASQLEQQILGAAGEQPTHSLRGRVS
jgi:hypothetical protein